MPPKSRILRTQQDAASIEGENPRERFYRIAEPRVSRIIDQIRSLGALNRAEYGPPNARDVEQMIGAMEAAVGELREAYRRPPGAPKAGFKFER